MTMEAHVCPACGSIVVGNFIDPIAAERKRIEELVMLLVEHEFIDTYEPPTMWIAVDRAAVLRIVRGERP